jgi:hypothetical protein
MAGPSTELEEILRWQLVMFAHFFGSPSENRVFGLVELYD